MRAMKRVVYSQKQLRLEKIESHPFRNRLAAAGLG